MYNSRLYFKILFQRVASSAVIILFLPVTANAIEVNAREYHQLPDNTLAILQYLDYDTSNTLNVDGSEVAGDNKLDAWVALFRLAYIVPLDFISENFTVDPQFIMPFASVDVRGVNDTVAQGDLLLFAAHKYALNREKRHFIGWSPFLSVPTGDYNKNNAVNVGNNRWAITNQFAWSRNVSFISEKLTFDVDYDITFFGNNNDFGAASQTLEQDPLHHLQTYLVYDVTPSFSITTSYQYLNGGALKVDGVDVANSNTDTHRWRAGFQWGFASNQHLIVQYGQDFETENGFEINDHVRIRYAYLFF